MNGRSQGPSRVVLLFELPVRTLLVAVLAALAMSLWPASALADVTYCYDGLSRLAGVVDASGNAAGYSYDAAGNALSIAKTTASTVSVFSFTPNNGPVSLTVTICGNGFSSTPGQNTVKFNGTVATVSSSTTTTIVVSVPSGATSGHVSVTSPAGTGTSSASFNVTAN